MNYDPKTDATIEHTGNFDRADFLRLAAACLDQAGASVEDLREYVARLDRADPTVAMMDRARKFAASASKRIGWADESDYPEGVKHWAGSAGYWYGAAMDLYDQAELAAKERAA